MADIALSPTSTSGTTNIYTISSPVNNNDRYYIELNDVSNWLLGIQTNAFVNGDIYSSFQDNTKLYSIGSISLYSFPAVIIRSTRVWFANLNMETGTTITIETKATVVV